MKEAIAKVTEVMPKVSLPRLVKGWPAAFFFDLDGTLVDTEMVWARAIVDFLSSHGATARLEDVAAMVFGHSWLDIHAELHRTFPELPRQPAEQDAVELRAAYQRLAVDPQSVVIPSSVAFLKKVSRLAPCAIVSGSPHADVEAAAQLCGVARQLKFVLGAEDYNRGKPAPDSYLEAAEKLDVDASQCVVIEDSSAGVAAGRAAGMHVLGLDRNMMIHQNFTGCEWLVHDLSEIDVDAIFGFNE